MEKSLQHSPKKLEALTSFRFIAACLVFVFHVGLFKDFQLGYLGVSFFFILSGFILAYNYKNLNFQNTRQLKYFFVARVSKIYPLHLLTFFLAVPYYFFIPLKHEPILYVFQAITNITLIHSFIPFGNISFNGVSWSLSDELFFYIMFPILLFFSVGVLKKNSKMLFFVFLIWISLLFIFSKFSPESYYSVWISFYFPITRLFEFYVGLVAGLFFTKYSPKIGRKLSIFYSTTLEVSSLMLLILLVFVSPYFNQNLRYGLIFIPACTFLIFIFGLQKGKISTLLSFKKVSYLGEISFSFYMVHNLVLSYIYFLWKPNINNSLLISFCFIGTILLSVFLYHCYEEPMRKNIRNIYKNRTRIHQDINNHKEII